MDKIVYIIRGIPGSGKSTLAKNLVDHDFLVCEADKYFIKEGEYRFDPSKLKEAHNWCKGQVEMYMKDSLINNQFYKKIAISNTFTMEWEMKPYFDLAEKYGYSVFSIIVENRHGGKNLHGVSDQKLEEMRSRFEISL